MIIYNERKNVTTYPYHPHKNGSPRLSNLTKTFMLISYL